MKVAIAFALSALGLAILTAPALAAQQGVSAEQRKACEDAAARVLPALRADEKESYIANCIANAAPPVTKR